MTYRLEDHKGPRGRYAREVPFVSSFVGLTLVGVPHQIRTRLECQPEDCTPSVS